MELNNDSLQLKFINILFPLLVGVFAFLFAVEQIYNYDIWWHLKAGQWALDHSAIPRVDSFSFSTKGAPWVYTSWLSSVILAFFYQFAGLNGLILLKAAIIGLSFGGACGFLIRRGLNPYLAVLVVGAAVPIARFRFLLRPQILAFPGGLVYFWALSNTALKTEKRILWLVPLLVLWVNLHGSAYLGLIMALCLLAEEGVLWTGDKLLLHQGKHPWPRETIALVLLLFAALFVTPYGVEYPRLVLKIGVLEDLVARSYAVGEHLPLRWGEHTGFWVLSLLTALSFVLAGKRSRIFYFLLFVGTGWLAFSSVRYVGVTAFLYALILGLNLREISTHNIFARLHLPSKIQLSVVLPLLVLLGVLLFRGEFGGEKVYRFGLGVNQSRFPVAAVASLNRAHYVGNVFNSWEYGGYLQWYVPGVRTVIDGRCLEAQLKLKAEMARMSVAEFQKFLQDNQITAAILLKKDRSLVDFFNQSPQFKMQVFDDQAVLFVPKGSAADQQTDAQGAFSLIHPERYDVSYLVPLAKGAQAGQAEKELRRAVVQSPRTFSAHYQLGVFLALQGRVEALDHYFRAVRLNSALGFSHFNIEKQVGRFALGHQRWKSAVKILEMAEEYGKQLDAEADFMLATAQYRLKNFSAAEKIYLRALTLKPEQTMTMINLGYLYLDIRQGQKAIAMFNRAVKLTPDNGGALYGLAFVLQQTGDPKARATWELFLERFPEGPLALKAKQFLAK